MIVLGIILFVIFFKEIVGVLFGVFSIILSGIGALLSTILGGK